MSKRILITRGTVCGGVAVEAGQLVEASDLDAQRLLAMKKAILAPVGEKRRAAEPAPEIEPEEEEAAPVGVKRAKR